MKTPYSNELWNTLCEVNTKMNRSISYCTDEDQYKIMEFWTDGLKTHKGDCEDFAIAKMNALIKAGVSDQSIALCTCKTETNEEHAVLIVSTTKGNFVLDNRSDHLKNFSDDFGYTWEYVPSYIKTS